MAGFSVESANTQEIAHYLFLRANSDSTCTLYVTDEEYTQLYTIACGKVPAQTVVTYGAFDNQFFINSPHFRTPLYGLVGGGLKPAVKEDSIQSDTTALDLPVGLCCVFGDRIAIAQGSIVYFSDPGVTASLLTFVAENAIPFDGTIYDLFQGPDGLYVVTSKEIAVLSQDALGQGQTVSGFIRKIPGYQAFDYRNVAQSNGQVIGLFRDGIIDTKTFEKTKLTNFSQKRSISLPVGSSATGDLRYGQIYSTSEGFAVVSDQKFCLLNVMSGVVSWTYTAEQSDLTLAGILKSREGNDLFLTRSAVLQFQGNREFDGYEESGLVDGYVCGEIPTPAEASPVLRFVSTESDNSGLRQLVAVEGRTSEGVTLAPTGAQVVGTDVWDSSEKYISPELRSKRHAFRVRRDSPSIEAVVEGSFSKVSVLAAEFKGQGSRRK